MAPVFASAQPSSPARAQKSVETAKAATPVESALDTARATVVTDPEKGLRLAQDARQMASRLPKGRERTLSIASAIWLQGEAYLRMKDVAHAKESFSVALKMIEPINEAIKLRGDLLMSRGAVLAQEGDAPEALDNFQNAFRIFQQLGEPRSQALALQSMGMLYNAASDGARAERYFKQAADVYDGDPALSLAIHNNRGNTLLVLERYGEAEGEYMQAIRLARELDQPMLEARVLGNLARAQVEAGDLDAAEKTLARGFALARGGPGEVYRQQLFATAARVASERGDLDRARRLIVQSFLGKGDGDYYAHYVAYQIFSKTGDAARALRHLETAKRLKDESTKVATSTSAALMAARFDFANQELRIAKLQREELQRRVELERSRARWQRTIFLGLGGATLVVIALLTIGLVTIRRSRNEVRAANDDLAESNIALEKALKAKTEFLATTSHEIRTPLNGILGMTQVMLSDTQVDGKVRDRIGIVHGAGLTMRALVDDILDVAKMETGNLTVEAAPMDLRATLRDVTRMWEEQAAAKGLSFALSSADAPQWIVSDCGRLRQVVFNLLSNALKFTERGGVTVRAYSEGERLKLAISDTGVGIPQEKREEIFESFRQVDAGTTRRFGGTGLGLTICRNLARALGGDIAVESVEGEGSTFTVDLPLVIAEAPAAEAPSEGGAIVILDRNPISRAMLRTIVKPRASDVCFAANPAEAVELMDGGSVTHLIVDQASLAGEGEDAVAALAALTEAARAAGAMTALLWSGADADLTARLKAAGADRVLEKPVRGPALIDSLFIDDEEKSENPAATKLVSRAA